MRLFSKGPDFVRNSLLRILVGCLLLFLVGVARAAQSTSSQVIQQQNGSATNATSLTLSLIGVPAAGHTIILALAYTNPANSGNIAVSGLGATWVAGQKVAGSGMTIAFFYGSPTSGVGQTITINVPNADTLLATCSDWVKLTTNEDPGSAASAVGINTTPQLSITTASSNTAVLTVTAYLGAPLVSPPQGDFVPLNPASNSSMGLVGGYKVANASGAYTNNVIFNTPVSWLSVGVALQSTGVNQPLFAATPLTDFAAGQQYLGKFPGLLYSDSNTLSGDHDADGRSFAQQIQPLDSAGTPSPDGKIAVVGIGMQNWSLELCTPNTPFAGCQPYTFFDDIAKTTGTNPQMTLVDCAQGGTFATDWTDLNSNAWKNCLTRMANAGYNVTPAQVQVVIYEQIDAYPKISLSSLSGSTCPANPIAGSAPDACVYEALSASVARTVKSEFPNTLQMFLHSRIYAGYATSKENPEPYAYEYGFSNKWLIQAQINQLAGAGTDPVAGDLSYPVAPWLAWGPYFWASGTTPRSDGQTWVGGDFQTDGTHISSCPFYGITCGVKKVADLLTAFYTTSPYTTWFMAAGSPTPSPSPTPSGVLTLSVANISFGRLPIGDTSAIKTVNITNAGGVSVTFNSIGVTGPNAGDFQMVGNTCVAALAAGKSCGVKLTFKATAAAGSTETATLSVSDSATNSPQTVALSGSPIAGLSTSPGTVNFGTVLQGQTSASKNLTVKNSHAYSIALQQVFSGAAAGDYSFAATTTCGANLAANTQCTDALAFTPATAGSRPATLTISDGVDTAAVVALTGSGK